MVWPSQSESDDDALESGSYRLRESRRPRTLREETAAHAGDVSMDEEDDTPPRQKRPHTRQPALVCTTESVKLLVTLLTCLFQGKKDQRVRCDVDADGMLFTSHSRGKSLQIKTSVGCELFDNFEFDATAVVVEDQTQESANEDGEDALEPQCSFALNLSALIECLSIFGPAALPTSALRLSYYPSTASLTLVVEDNGVICECSMQVLELDGNDVGQLEFETAFEQSAVVGRCIMQSQPLHDAFAELYDLPSAASVTISMFPESLHALQRERCLSLSAASETGSCEIDFARSSSAFIEFSCATDGDRAPCEATFHVAVLQQAFKALAHSNETFLRMNADGILSVQHMIESGGGDKAFVDALISPEDTTIA